MKWKNLGVVLDENIIVKFLCFYRIENWWGNLFVCF